MKYAGGRFMLIWMRTGKLVMNDRKMDGGERKAIMEQNLLEAAEEFRIQWFSFHQNHDSKHSITATLECFT